MGAYYLYQCPNCGWERERYRNLKRCPDCRADVRRIDSVTWYHGTDKGKAESILLVGFRPDSWFAKRMEDAVVFGGSHVLSVELQRTLVPDSWQCHIPDSVPACCIQQYYIVREEKIRRVK